MQTRHLIVGELYALRHSREFGSAATCVEVIAADDTILGRPTVRYMAGPKKGQQDVVDPALIECPWHHWWVIRDAEATIARLERESEELDPAMEIAMGWVIEAAGLPGHIYSDGTADGYVPALDRWCARVGIDAPDWAAPPGYLNNEHAHFPAERILPLVKAIAAAKPDLVRSFIGRSAYEYRQGYGLEADDEEILALDLVREWFAPEPTAEQLRGALTHVSEAVRLLGVAAEELEAALRMALPPGTTKP